MKRITKLIIILILIYLMLPFKAAEEDIPLPVLNGEYRGPSVKEYIRMFGTDPEKAVE